MRIPYGPALLANIVIYALTRAYPDMPVCCVDLTLDRMHRHREVAAKLLREVHRDPRMNSTLPVQEAAVIIDGHYGAVPDAGMDVEALAAVAAEGDKLVRRDVIARQR